MKKYYILFLFIFSIIGASAQDRYPDIRNFKTINKGSATLESKNPEYSQKKFMRGWHWDGNVYINDSLGSNHIDIGSMAFRDSIVHTRKIHNSMLTIQPDINPQSRCFSRANSHYDDEALFHFRSAQYEAGLKTDKKYNYLDYNDKENPVFGFRYQSDRGELVDEGNNKILKYISLYDSSALYILKNIYPKAFIKEAVKWRPAVSGDTLEYKNKYINYCENYNGRFLILAIRLKCYEDSIDYIGNKPVLSIRLPIRYKGDNETKNLKFSHVPDSLHQAIDVVKSFDNDGPVIMGRRRKVIQNKQNNSEFLITTNMLMPAHPDHSDYIRGCSRQYRDYLGYITIYAKLFFYGDLAGLDTFDARYNRIYYNYKNYGNPGTLDSIEDFDINVYYHNTVDIGIDWVRLETPHTHQVLWGQKNTEIKGYLDTAISNLADLSQANSNNQILRIVDVVEGSEMAWDGMKYMKNMCGDIFAGENETPYQYLYQHYVGMKTSWLGLFKVLHTVARPFLKYGYGNYGGQITNEYNSEIIDHPDWTFNLRTGAYSPYLHKNNVSDLSYNTLKNLIFNSGYETYYINKGIDGNDNTQWSELINNDTTYQKYIKHTDEAQCFQSYYEYHIQKHYNDFFFSTGDTDSFDIGKNAGFIYGEKDWWGQNFNLQEFREIDLNNIKSINKTFCNMLTSEEQRLISHNFIIMGAKGLLYDGQTWGDRKTALKLVNFEGWDDPRGYILASWGKSPTWKIAYKEEKERWSSEENLEKYGIVRNPDLGTDFCDEWFYKYFLWGAYPDREPLFANGPMFTTFNLRIREMNKSIFPPIPIFYQNNNSDYNPYTTLSKLMGLKDDGMNSRIYLGMNSQRVEIERINKFLSAYHTNSLLINSKLAGWIGKGFRRVSNFDTKTFDNNPLSYVVDTLNVKTYKLRGYDFVMNEAKVDPISEQATMIDSGFYDLTILRTTDPRYVPAGAIDKDALKNLFILCVQNRRTDPLTVDSWLRSSPNDGLGNELKTIRHFELTDDSLDVFSKEKINFLSQAEYDKYLSSTPNTNPEVSQEKYEHFGNMYWSKFGARKIEVPLLRYGLSDAPNDGINQTNYRITELGSLSRELKRLYWRNNLYMLKDKIIRNANKIILSAYLQPGEAKYYLINPNSPIDVYEDYLSVDFEKVKDPHISPLPNFASVGGITGKIKYPEPLNEFTIKVEVLKDSTKYALESASECVTLYEHFEVKLDSVSHILDTNKKYTCVIEPARNNESFNLFNIHFNDIDSFPVKLSYEYNLKDSILISKDTIIYFGGAETFYKRNLEAIPEATSIEKLSLKNLRTLPNPSNTEFDLEFNSDINQELEITIIDNLGKDMIEIINYFAIKGANKLKINTSSLPVGNYILSVNNKMTKYDCKISVVR